MNRMALVVVVVVMQSSCLYSMELIFHKKVNPKQTEYKFNKTKITLKQALFDSKKLDGKVGFICLGCYEQQLGQGKTHNGGCAGDIHTSYCKSVKIEVVEPLLVMNTHMDEYSYYVEERCAKNDQFISGTNWHGAKALEIAKKHLDLCYKNVLTRGSQQEFDKRKKSIALPILGIEMSFPIEDAVAVAVLAILEFIKNNPTVYSKIKLFAQKEFEYDQCKELLDSHQYKNI